MGWSDFDIGQYDVDLLVEVLEAKEWAVKVRELLREQDKHSAEDIYNAALDICENERTAEPTKTRMREIMQLIDGEG